MYLSKRLQMVANCVSKGSLVADVGCDHAYISLYLVENEIALRSIALDINEGPLRKANENVREYGFEDKISIRLSNGLEKLCPGEVNSIVIAGMGGILMIQILSEGIPCVTMADELILQPQSEAEKVREYLHNINFILYEENMCIDDGKYYVVIHAKRKAEIERDCEDAIQLPSILVRERTHNKYGKILLKRKHPILKEYLEREYCKLKLICSKILEHPSDQNDLRLEEIKVELVMLEFALSYYNKE